MGSKNNEDQSIPGYINTSRERMNTDSIKITFMEVNEIEESARTLSIAMLKKSLHIAVLKGSAEKQRLKIESGSSLFRVPSRMKVI